ncbi:MAG TPA: acyl-CoA carboxylase subunit beta [Candidatus Thermoplasmatota archaeon]|nr:acyl-CoA carboxylase subunit beta [Candidatus Thermoplasmatota archaeon]
MTAPKASTSAPAPAQAKPAAAPAQAAGKGGSREDRLRADIERLQKGGPEKYRTKLAEDGKLFVRDRLGLFFPDGLSFEDGLFANNLRAEEGLAADGMVTGAARMEDRTVFVIANDYTVKAGSMAERGVEKFLRVQDRALRAQKPILYLIDSSGARITDQAGFFANIRGIGKYFYNHSLLSGKVPQVSVLYGPCIAGAAYTPIFCDFMVMVRGMSALAIASPRMVEMVTGEKIEMQDLGGADLHMEESGQCHFIVDTEQEAALVTWRLMGYLPDNCDERPRRTETREPSRSGSDLDRVVPEDPNKAFDMHEVIERLVDADSWLEVKAGHAAELLTGFARVGGHAVGIVANNSAVRAGAIFPHSADKAAEFITTCDAFNVPLLFLCDTPGFMVGSEVEKEGILKRGKKFIYATSTATVPKLCIVVRKAYGAGIYAMCGPAFEPDATLALPGAEIAVMGAEAAINAVYANHIAKVPAGPERQRFVEEKRAEYKRDIDMHVTANDLIVDHIVPPSELRKECIARLDAYQDKHLALPRKGHGTVI